MPRVPARFQLGCIHWVLQLLLSRTPSGTHGDVVAEPRNAARQARVVRVLRVAKARNLRSSGPVAVYCARLRLAKCCRGALFAVFCGIDTAFKTVIWDPDRTMSPCRP